jgi:hypothetical protein
MIFNNIANFSELRTDHFSNNDLTTEEFVGDYIHFFFNVFKTLKLITYYV